MRYVLIGHLGGHHLVLFYENIVFTSRNCFIYRYLNEKAQTNVTSEAKAKFLKPLDRFDAGHSLKKNFGLNLILF